MCGLRIFAGISYTIYRATSYLGLLTLSVLMCSPKISFLAEFVSDESSYSSSLEKFELGSLSSQATPKEKNFCTGSDFLFMAVCALDLTFPALQRCEQLSPNWGSRTLIRGHPR